MLTLQDFSQLRIIVVGDVMLDLYYWGEVSRISPEAPVPVVRIKNKTRTLGGAGNVALNLAGIQCQTYLLGIKGQDMAATRNITDHGTLACYPGPPPQHHLLIPSSLCSLLTCY